MVPVCEAEANEASCAHYDCYDHQEQTVLRLIDAFVALRHVFDKPVAENACGNGSNETRDAARETDIRKHVGFEIVWRIGKNLIGY